MKIINSIKKSKNIFTVSKNPNHAQRFWKAANSSKTFKVINPLENTLEFLNDFG